MKIIQKERGCDKTLSLLKLSHNTNKVIVVQSRAESHNLRIKSQELGLVIPIPITYNEYLTKGKSIDAASFLIDNVNMFLYTISNKEVEAITLNK